MEFDNCNRKDVLRKIFTKPEKILDVGGGTGIIAEWLIKEVGCTVLLIDNDDQALVEAKKRGINTGWIDLDGVGVVASQWIPETYDTICWLDNIEHLISPLRVMDALHYLLKPDGRLIISFPNMSYWYYRYLYLKTGTPQFGDCADKPWEYQHIRCFNLQIIKRMFDLTGFKLIRVYGVNDKKLKLQRFLMKHLPNLFASILVIEARKI